MARLSVLLAAKMLANKTLGSAVFHSHLSPMFSKMNESLSMLERLQASEDMAPIQTPELTLCENLAQVRAAEVEVRISMRGLLVDALKGTWPNIGFFQPTGSGPKKGLRARLGEPAPNP